MPICWTGNSKFEILSCGILVLFSFHLSHVILFWQPWRAATLCPFGVIDFSPSVEALIKNGRSRTLQAIELESGIGHQWRLWKWASYCTSEVSSICCPLSVIIVFFMALFSCTGDISELFCNDFGINFIHLALVTNKDV